jgi:hypothetical protein
LDALCRWFAEALALISLDNLEAMEAFERLGVTEDSLITMTALVREVGSLRFHSIY